RFFRQLFNLSGRNSGETLRVDRLHHSARVERAAKNFEPARAKIVADINLLDAESTIGLIAAKPANGFAIGQPIERCFNVNVASGFENRGQHSLGQLENIVGCYEGGFDVDLGEFRLPIGAQVFVTKTFRDLKIFFDAGDLEQLFVLLRRLRESVKLSRHQSAWHQKITRAFRRALRQNRRLDFDVALRIEKVARRLGGAMADAKIAG